MNNRKTAGELSLQASSDTTKYDPLEVGHAVCENIEKEVNECIQIHNKIFDEDEYCICYVWADDPLIKGVRRRKFFGHLYLPSPRPDQGVFLYNKRSDILKKRLWILPKAEVMEKLYLSPQVPKEYITMKQWSMAFYDGCFWEFIRKQHNIDMLSEVEYLRANREKLIKAGCKEVDTNITQPFDFSKVSINHIVDTNTARIN